MSETTEQVPVKDRIRYALADLPNRVTIGFEVETQYESQEREPEIDTDGMRDYAVDNIDMQYVCSHANLSYMQRWIDALNVDSAEELAEKLNLDWDAILDSYVDDMDTDNWIIEDDDDENGGSRDQGNYILRRMAQTVSTAGWDNKEDGSVSGPEFASPICVGRNDAIKHATALFDALDNNTYLSIDTECSCHIHIRMHDVQHKGHNLLQQLLFEELFNDLAAIPDCIKQRCATEPRWIQPSANGGKTYTGKYNPIQRHSGYHTWEFRIFGNVSNVTDFQMCLDAAIAAMGRAYARFLEGDRKELPADLWCTLASRAMSEWQPIQDSPEYGKYWEKPAEAPADIFNVVVESATPVSFFIRNGDNDCDCPGCLTDRRQSWMGETIQVRDGRQVLSSGRHAFVPIQEPELATIS